MRKLIYLLPFAIMAFSSCLKSSDDTSTALNVPSGTFAGQFRIVHKRPSGSIDTTNKAQIILTISAATGYAVTGDTTVNHAGSTGDFTMNATQIQFIDKTYPKTGVPAKTHLSGVYYYNFSGTIFQIQATSGDTLALQYDLKKTN